MQVCVPAHKEYKQSVTCNHSQKHMSRYMRDGSNYSGVLPLTFVPATPFYHL